MSNEEKRQFHRIHFNTKATIELAGQTLQADLIDISLKGVLISLPPGWTPTTGEVLTLNIPLSDSAQIHMTVITAHHKNNQVGFTCQNIDLDSITHIRRLVALNSGDEEMLERELQALIQI